jgi:atypical dual specificity phosphatase
VAAKGLAKSFQDKLQYLQLDISDNPGTKIHQFFLEACAFIEETLANKGCVLVHCLGGKSRSVTIMTAYCMLRQKMTADEALAYVRARHKLAYPNPGFLKQLGEFEKKLALYFTLLPGDKDVSSNGISIPLLRSILSNAPKAPPATVEEVKKDDI